ncbi:MAG: tRNA lysidine(34) synthetase TilS [Thermomicrobiales bacterium]
MPNRPQSANRLTERVHAAVRAVVPFAGASNLLIACSGGADSTCLAHAVVAVAQQNGWTVTIAHVRHGLRPDDSRDDEAVRALAASLNTPFAHGALTWPDHAQPERVSEAALRAGRYAALARMARAAGAGVILTGHTMDDQAETILLHLLRGTGLTGLTGMDTSAALPIGDENSNEQTEDHLRIVRPLLGIQRAETEAYCAAHRLTVIHDPSNDDQQWTRNWLRHTVLPELRTRNPAIAETLARAARTLGADAQFLEEETARAFTRSDWRIEKDVSVIDHRAFASEPPALRMRMVRTLLEQYGSSLPGADLVKQADASLSAERSTRILHFGSVACAVIDGRMIVGAPDDVRRWIIRYAEARYPLFHGNQPLETNATFPLYPVPDAEIAYACTVNTLEAPVSDLSSRAVQMQYLALPAGAQLTVRNRRPGDRFHPVGRQRALALQDYLSARGIPALVRDWLPLLVVNDTIAWVIGHDCSARFATSRENATHVALLHRRES